MEVLCGVKAVEFRYWVSRLLTWRRLELVHYVYIVHSISTKSWTIITYITDRYHSSTYAASNFVSQRYPIFSRPSCALHKSNVLS
jgi:hypothetical protein